MVVYWAWRVGVCENQSSQCASDTIHLHFDRDESYLVSETAWICQLRS